jgi:hypothetical protein
MIDRQAFCAIDNPTELLSWVASVELGKYDEYGRLKGTDNFDDISDSTAFVLKYFWDIAPTMTPEYATECISRNIENNKAFHELVDAVSEAGRETVSDLLKMNSSVLIDKDQELYAGLFHVAWLMSMLRRTFYTAAYRGGQSSMQPFVVMNEHINDYIKEKD